MINKEFIKNFSKVCSAIKSCKTLEQLTNAYEWGSEFVFNCLYDRDFRDMRKECHDILYESFLEYLEDIYKIKQKELNKFVCE